MLTSLYIGTCGPSLKGSARSGHAGDLGDRGEAATDLLQAVLAQAHHAFVDRDPRDLVGRRAGDGEGPDVIRDQHHLVEADAALVAGAAAARAANRLVGLES